MAANGTTMVDWLARMHALDWGPVDSDSMIRDIREWRDRGSGLTSRFVIDASAVVAVTTNRPPRPDLLKWVLLSNATALELLGLEVLHASPSPLPRVRPLAAGVADAAPGAPHRLVPGRRGVCRRPSNPFDGRN